MVNLQPNKSTISTVRPQYFRVAGGIQFIEALYPYLQQSTEVGLSFNDPCDQLRHGDSCFQQIRSELSHLAESLTDRFQLEDQLIEYVHKSNERILQ